jgi:hypothetical protein
MLGIGEDKKKVIRRDFSRPIMIDSRAAKLPLKLAFSSCER